MNERMKIDLIQHAIQRVGQVMSDTCDLLETQEDVRELYAVVLGHAMCSVCLSLDDDDFPLFKRLPTTQRVLVVASHLSTALDPKGNLIEAMRNPQMVSDYIAALREVKRLFNFVVEVEKR